MNGARDVPHRAALAGLALAAGMASAADDVNPQDCRPQGDPQQLNACAVREFRVADARLNNRYREVMTSLTTDKRIALRHEQNDWIKRRDPRCKAQARASEGGAAWPLAFYGCLEKLAAERVTVLDGWEGRP